MILYIKGPRILRDLVSSVIRLSATLSNAPKSSQVLLRVLQKSTCIFGIVQLLDGVKMRVFTPLASMSTQLRALHTNSEASQFSVCEL